MKAVCGVVLDKKSVRFLAAALVGTSLFCGGAVFAQELQLVGNKVSTYVDEHGLASRQMDIVNAALPTANTHKITATTQAWYGSGLRSGKFNGYIDHYSLNAKQSNYVYSKPYMTVNLHLASKTSEVINVALLDQLGRARVGIETRFANTDQVRGERSVSWARSQVFFENIRQLADRRVDFIMADKDMIEQFNKLLEQKGEQVIQMSKVPFYIVEISLAISKEVKDAEKIIAEFDQNITEMRQSSELEKLIAGDTSKVSLLDQSVYQDILTKW